MLTTRDDSSTPSTDCACHVDRWMVLPNSHLEDLDDSIICCTSISDVAACESCIARTRAAASACGARPAACTIIIAIIIIIVIIVITRLSKPH